jgi:hypothetical protein
MAGGFWAGDAIATGVELANTQMQGARDAQANYNQVKSLLSNLDQMTMSNAANYAEKQALRVALKKFDPNHPLLVNLALQERIKAAGQRALTLTDDWDAVKAAGLSFKI